VGVCPRGNARGSSPRRRRLGGSLAPFQRSGRSNARTSAFAASLTLAFPLHRQDDGIVCATPRVNIVAVRSFPCLFGSMASFMALSAVHPKSHLPLKSPPLGESPASTVSTFPTASSSRWPRRGLPRPPSWPFVAARWSELAFGDRAGICRGRTPAEWTAPNFETGVRRNSFYERKILSPSSPSSLDDVAFPSKDCSIAIVKVVAPSPSPPSTPCSPCVRAFPQKTTFQKSLLLALHKRGSSEGREKEFKPFAPPPKSIQDLVGNGVFI